MQKLFVFSKSWTCLRNGEWTRLSLRVRTRYQYFVCTTWQNIDSVSSLHHNIHRLRIESSTVYVPSSTIGASLKIDLPWTKTDTVDDEKTRKESRNKINKLFKTFFVEVIKQKLSDHLLFVRSIKVEFWEVTIFERTYINLTSIPSFCELKSRI